MKNTHLINITLFSLIAIISLNKNYVNATTNNKKMDFDYLDAYKLKLGNTALFGDFKIFISDVGIPEKISVAKNGIKTESKNEFEKAISAVERTEIVALHYKGIEMWYLHDNYIVPSTIDFRHTDKKISYGEIIFDAKYSIDRFKKDFPKSGNPSFKFPQSFFSMATQENGNNLEHFILKRKKVDDPNAEPLIEFTFENGKLIYILFANF